MTTPPAVEIEDVRKTFGRRKALDRVGIRVAPGEMVALIGTSGSGKSTLLRHIAGLIPADRRGGDPGPRPRSRAAAKSPVTSGASAAASASFSSSSTSWAG